MSTENLLKYSIVVLLLPILSFVINIFFGKKLKRASGVIGTSILMLSLVISIIIAFTKLSVYSGAKIIQTSAEWVNFGNVPGIGPLSIVVGIGIDNLSAIMLVVVTLISALVHLFSTEYMSGDPKYTRYFAYLGFFTFSMLGIVLTNNFFLMYVFWELVGISSYLLIGFWYEKRSASNAAKKAFLVNRVGDLGFWLGILILFVSYKSFSFDVIFENIKSGNLPFNSGFYLTLAGILVFCGAIGKSAQFPLHVWLPDAMEGPTPVSALIHAATMVAAGVYLVARVFVMFTADALTFIAYIGAITAFVAATIAITQNDIKKVLAYSTVSQLGYMIMALGVGAYTSGFFHLVTHAWFKAALFLGSGSVIHAMHHALHKAGDHHTDPQDIRNMGGLRKTMPITFITFLMCTFAISGVPFTSGFMSKDGILAGTLAFAHLSGHWLIPIIGFTAAGMTAFYMFRLVIITFTGKPKTTFAENTHESKLVMTLPLIVLAILSFWFFYSVNPFDASKGWFANWIKPPQTVVPAQYQWNFLTTKVSEEVASIDQTMEVEATKTVLEEEIHHNHTTAMILSLSVAGIGILLAFVFYFWKKVDVDALTEKIKPIYNFSLNKWYIDELYQSTIVNGTTAFSRLLGWFDNTIIDGAINGVAAISKWFSFFSGKFDNVVIDGIVNLTAYGTGFIGLLFRKAQTGKVQTYLIIVLIGLVLLFYFVS
ncbi:MAG TPA: NADH-quinone oxidoreductase subunit L [Bacteroidota bacterium]|nr:NADH-quinone oxidoreductase subunit L [Bacteroidota bacterium]